MTRPADNDRIDRMDRNGGGDSIDRRLRRELEPPPAVGARVAAAALRPTPARPRRLIPVAALTTVLAAILAVGVWQFGRVDPAAPGVAVGEPLRIANFGELVTIVDPGGGARLSGPARRVEDFSPRLIIRLGDEHAP